MVDSVREVHRNWNFMYSISMENSVKLITGFTTNLLVCGLAAHQSFFMTDDELGCSKSTPDLQILSYKVRVEKYCFT